MAMKSDVLGMVSQGLKTAEVIDSPWPISFFKPFDDDFYEELLSQLPETRHYEAFHHVDLKGAKVREDGTFPRMLFSMKDDSLARLPSGKSEFLRELRDSLTSREMVDLFFDHLKHDLVNRFGKNYASIDRFPTVKLGRDFDGYEIKPHPDSSNRIYTAQIYLPRSPEMKFAGTSVFKKTMGFYREMHRLPYIPNRGFTFVPTKISFHGVKKLALTEQRDNLHISCFLKEGNDY